MPSITFGGINTGLPPNLVDQLVEAEKIPIQKMEVKKDKSQTRLDLVTDLEGRINKVKDSISTLASTKGFNDIKLISGDTNAVQGVVDPSAAVSGSYNIEIMEMAQRAAAITNGFPDKDRTEIGVGYFSFETAKGDVEVYVNGENNTLQGAATAINNAGVGVRATVINDRKDPDEPFKLMISADSVGGDNNIKYPTLYFLDGDQDMYFDVEKEAKNGVIKVDGIEFEVDSNTVEDIIPGVTLELKQATPGRTVNVTVKEDLEVVSGKVKDFVDGLNQVFGFIQQQNRLTQDTDTSRTLGGDSLLRSIENKFRRLVLNPQMGVQTPIRRLNQLGIEFNRNGTLDFSEEKFNTTLARDPAAVTAFLAGDGFSVGLIPTLKRTVSETLNTAFGPIAIRKRALTDKISRIDKQIEQKERHVEKKEQVLRRKFAKLEETMSRLKSQGAALGAVSGQSFSLGGAKMGQG